MPIQGENGSNNRNDVSHVSKDQEYTKRFAQQGQWRTPPLPTFAATNASRNVGDASASNADAENGSATEEGHSEAEPPDTLPHAHKLPTTPDEYARMLHEAYRRGAEAGARALSVQSVGQNSQRSSTSTMMPSIVSTTEEAASRNSENHATVSLPKMSPSPSVPSPAAITGGMPPPPTVQYLVPPPLSSQLTHSISPQISTTTSTPMPTVATNTMGPPTSAALASSSAPVSLVHVTNYSGASIPTVPSNASSISIATPHSARTDTTSRTMTVPTLQVGTVHVHPIGNPVPGMETTTGTNATGVTSAARSISLPDMSSYAAHANDEEEKRRKRLARNRASARLRRLKKKNLVDSYEGEVGILESALSKLRCHRWGSATSENNHDALIDALSMERGQQSLTPEKRRELIKSIVEQQTEQVTNLMECQLENWVLAWLASSPPASTTADNNSPTAPISSALFPQETSDSPDELDKLTSELQSLLQLTPDQLSRISLASQGCTREIHDLFVVDSCLKIMLSNDWLLDEGVDEVAGQFTSILNPTQLSKFLLWSDHNADAIERLEYVGVGLGESVVESSPIFEFGIDEGIDGAD